MAVCQIVCSNVEPIGFSAVKRTVGLHQEIVSRILKRLVNHGAIEKVEGKYRRRTGQ
jgi:DNA-binding HxlR family transcriptional regulator